MAKRGNHRRESLPLDLMLDDDGIPPCEPLDDCEVCTLLQRPGEAWADYLARISALFKASPNGHGVVRAS